MSADPVPAGLRAFAERHGLDLIYRSVTASTNADVIEHYQACGRAALAVSEAQTAGRGRRGRQWHSPPGGNIYCTLGLFKTLPAQSQALLSIVTGIALCRALRRGCAAQVDLKWPNDLLVGGRKLGGILLESRLHAREEFFFAVGFGLNLRLAPVDREQIGRPATSLEETAAGKKARDELLPLLLGELREALERFEAADAGRLAAEFARYDAFHDREVDVLHGDRRIRGISRGIAEDGQLRLETGQGLQLFAAAEISLDPESACC